MKALNPVKMASFWQAGYATPFSSNTGSSSTSSTSSDGNSNDSQQNQSENQQGEKLNLSSAKSFSSLVAKSLLPTRKRLRLDPSNKLFFPYEPGKQVRSAIGIKNASKSYVAFKFQTTAPKSCYMHPPGHVLAPGEALIATVFKFAEPAENNDKPSERKSRVKFKILSLKVKGEMEYIPEMFDEQKDQVAVEQILRVAYLDPNSPSPALEKLRRLLAEAEAQLETRKRPPQEAGSRRQANGGLVIDEWKERRDKYLAKRKVEVDSI